MLCTFLVLPEFTSKQILDDNTARVTELYRLIKKFQAIRTIVRILVVSVRNILIIIINLRYCQKEYNDSKLYPIIPR